MRAVAGFVETVFLAEATAIEGFPKRELIPAATEPHRVGDQSIAVRGVSESCYALMAALYRSVAGYRPAPEAAH